MASSWVFEVVGSVVAVHFPKSGCPSEDFELWSKVHVAAGTRIEMQSKAIL